LLVDEVRKAFWNTGPALVADVGAWRILTFPQRSASAARFSGVRDESASRLRWRPSGAIADQPCLPAAGAFGSMWRSHLRHGQRLIESAPARPGGRDRDLGRRRNPAGEAPIIGATLPIRLAMRTLWNRQARAAFAPRWIC